MWAALTAAYSEGTYKLFQKGEIKTNNFVFKLHYRVTFLFLLGICAVVWGSDIFGDKVSCGHSRAEDESKSNEKLDHVINSYCLTLGLFTLPRHNIRNSTNGEVKYAGVGPGDANDDVRKLGWYQWVHYVLFFQALSFYLPKLIWRMEEKKTMLSFVEGFNTIEAHEDAKKRMNDAEHSLFYRIRLYQHWGIWLAVCESLNLVNVVIQWFLTDWFLQGNFGKLGKPFDNPDFSILDIAFPKMAKCTFLKFGPTGGLQENDVYCILTFNIVYEKIYLFLWFWYIFLMTLTSMALIHRLVSYLTFKTRFQYNVNLYEFSASSYDNSSEDIQLLIKRFSYYDWMFLQYLLSNLDSKLAAKLVKAMANTIRQEDYLKRTTLQIR